MSTRRKLFYAFIIPTLIATTAIFVVLRLSRDQEKLLVADAAQQLQQSVDQVVTLYENQLLGVVDDYSYWDEIFHFAQNPDPAWAQNNMATILSSFDLNAVWVLNIQKEAVYEDYSITSSHLKDFCFDDTMLKVLYEDRFISFYIKADDHVTFFQGATIHRTTDPDRLEEPVGYFFVAKCWYDELLESIQSLTNSSIRFHTGPEEAASHVLPTEVVYTRPLPNWDKSTTTQIVFMRELDFIALMHKTTNLILVVLIVAATAAIWLLSYLVERYFTKPLSIAGQMIKTNDTEHLHVLKNNTTDFQVIGGLLEDFILQKELLEKEKEKVEVADQLKTTFLANMSHEIRTPLNGVLGFAELLKNNTLSESQRNRYVDVIFTSGHHLLELMNDIIDLSKIEAGHMRLVRESFSVTIVFKELLIFFRENRFIREKGLQLVLSHELDDHMVMQGDKMRLRQVMINLLNNAAKFTEEGSIIFGGKMQSPDVILFYVRDTGVGISDENIQLIFDRFSKGENSTRLPLEGAGLGLSISRGLVHMMGGTIWAEQNEDAGSVFYFTLPRELV